MTLLQRCAGCGSTASNVDGMVPRERRSLVLRLQAFVTRDFSVLYRVQGETDLAAPQLSPNKRIFKQNTKNQGG